VCFITDLERGEARELKLDKPWLYDPKLQCGMPGCVEKIKPGVAVCWSCGAILDREKAARFGLGLNKAEELKGRTASKSGKPKSWKVKRAETREVEKK
jgi:hypothetical protein